MATLYEISFAYEESLQLLRARNRELRAALKTAETPSEQYRLRRRLAELDQPTREMRKLAKMTRHYYDKGYVREKGYTI